MDRSVFHKPKTLCWDCANAVPDKKGHGCSWSRDLIPVNGWVATKGKYNQSSYRVEKCPEFVPDATPSMVPVKTLEIPNEPEEPPPPPEPDPERGEFCPAPDEVRKKAKAVLGGLSLVEA